MAAEWRRGQVATAPPLSGYENHFSGNTETQPKQEEYTTRVSMPDDLEGLLLEISLITDRVDLIRKAETSHLGHINHYKIEFKISVDMRKSASKTSTLDMRRADFRLLREYSKEANKDGEGLEVKPYEDQLRSLRLFSLDKRRLRRDVTVLFTFPTSKRRGASTDFHDQ
ncbi:hypothetical protein TURU_020612 [Turdus rufiventris]|nr:hypothetical protein TURU_020612 [Turdus rufiventris]